MKIPEENHWASWSDEQTIKELRKWAGVMPLGEAEYHCLRCKKKYLSQTIGGKRGQFFCYDCREWVNRQNDEWL